MAKKKQLQTGPKPRGSAPTRSVKRLRPGDEVFLPADFAKLVKKEPLAKRIPTKRKELQVLTLEISSGPAKGKQIEYVYALDDRVELKTTPFLNRVVNWFRKLKNWKPFDVFGK